MIASRGYIGLVTLTTLTSLTSLIRVGVVRVVRVVRVTTALWVRLQAAVVAIFFQKGISSSASVFFR